MARPARDPSPGQLPLFDAAASVNDAQAGVSGNWPWLAKTQPRPVSSPVAAQAGSGSPPVTASNEPPAMPPSRRAPPSPSKTNSATPALPTQFRHPQAQHEIRLDGQLVAFLLKRAKRRTIGFTVGLEGLTVSAPRWTGIAEINSALTGKSGWILRKLADQHERHRQLRSAKVEWRDGTTLPFLGAPLVLAVGQRPGVRAGTVWLDSQAASTQAASTQDATSDLAQRVLHVALPHDASGAQVRDPVFAWFRQQALQLFEQRCRHYAEPLGVRYSRISLSSAETRWGSASSSGAIRLNWRLIHFALPTIDYVVAHELAHLREMNHSPRFWAVVQSVVPHYQQLRRTLKSDTLPQF